MHPGAAHLLRAGGDREAAVDRARLGKRGAPAIQFSPSLARRYCATVKLAAGPGSLRISQDSRPGPAQGIDARPLQLHRCDTTFARAPGIKASQRCLTLRVLAQAFLR